MSQCEGKQILLSLFNEYTHEECDGICALDIAGSHRKYYRLTNAKDDISIIGTVSNDISENEAFVYLSQHFLKKGLHVPEVYAVSKNQDAYIQQDLGDLSLYSFLGDARKSNAYGAREIKLLETVICDLVEFQFRGSQGIDFKKCYPVESFGRRSVMWDLNYFKYCFLKPVGIDFNEDLLEDDFESLASCLLTETTGNTFMYRDFQSRNILVYDNAVPYYIDFQGGRRGPFYYDLASFLWQTRSNYPTELRNHLINVYFDSLSKYQEIDKNRFEVTLMNFVIFRMIQVLGAYGFRGNIEGKELFRQQIPKALHQLHLVLEQSAVAYPYLKSIIGLCLIRQQGNNSSENKELTVTVMSFSYKRGLPKDDSGNGGGFIFDCRAIHNPGRYDEYKHLSGLDVEVRDFLDKKSDIHEFMKNVYSLVDMSIENYIQRGFTGLTISFGCTGGQHRSVYAAELMKNHILEKYNVKIRLIHREQALHQ